MKRIITLTLLLALVLTMAPQALASEATPSGACGESATWSFANGTLTISGTGAIDPAYPNHPWKDHIEQMEHIVVEEGITEIPTYCFISHQNVKTISLPDSLITIGTQALQSCNSLTEITIPKNVESIGLFYGEQQAASVLSGTALENINVDPENQHFYSIDGVLFDGRTNTLICYPMGKTAQQYTVPAGTRSIGYGAFWHSTMETLTLPAGLETIGNSAFFGADFTAIEIPQTVTSIGTSSFENCDKLSAVTVPENVREILQYAFSSCEMLDTITILNPECAIAANSNAIEEDAVIHGYPNSTAQAYAQRYGRGFVDLRTGQQYTYGQGNATYIALLPGDTGGTAPSFSRVIMSNASGDITGYQPNIVLERDTGNATYQEMLAFVNDLTKDCITDYEKAQKINSWVHENMTYVFGHMGQGVTAEGVYSIWKSRVGNCEGYTQLNNFLLHLVGIPTATITSYDHTWTAALIDGTWIMIDSTNDIFDAPPDAFEDIMQICFAVNDNIVCVIDDLSGVKLASYSRSVLDHAEVTEITIPSYITHIYSSTFFLEDAYGAATTHLTIRGTAGSYAESYLKANLPHYNSYSYEGDWFIAKVGKALTEDDAIYLLRHVLFPDLYPYENAPDYTGDGKVTEDDAIYLLRHVLFPDLYPL